MLNLEKETGIILASSPTLRAGYEILSELPKEKHESSMLSLDKTKEITTLQEWLADQKGVLSWKLDGLTVILEYREGTLFKAVTRGNGEVGEVITNNAKVFRNIPYNIPFLGDLTVRGEAVIRYSDFEIINQRIEEEEAKYKNPRNLCSGSVRQLNNEITAKRNVNFLAFSLVHGRNAEPFITNAEHGFLRVEEQMAWMEELGFETVERKIVTSETVEGAVHWFSDRVKEYDFPSDGLVLLYDDVIFGKSLGSTSKFPRNAIAYKWKDEMRETKLLDIEWSASRTGLINPVAIFEPVELEGTTVSRASLHNISIMEGLELGFGDTILVYKANMIIPQVAENITRSGMLPVPEHCPVCDGKAEVRSENEIKALYCVNPSCLAKKIKSFAHFVSRDAMNVEGLSEATLEKLIAKGIIKVPADLFHLSNYHDEIVEMEGFGEKSYQNLLEAVEKCRIISLPKLIYSLGIPNIGLSNAKLICKEFQWNLEQLYSAKKEDLVEIPGIGEVIADTFIHFFNQKENMEILEELRKEVELEPPKEETGEQNLVGKVFVITGSLERFANRDALKYVIEQQGGKVTGSVTSKTSYLINNDTLSPSSKNKKAKELNIPIITEEQFIELKNMEFEDTGKE